LCRFRGKYFRLFLDERYPSAAAVQKIPRSSTIASSLPSAARVRQRIPAKNLDVALAAPPGGTRSEAYRAIYAVGQVPALEVDGLILAGPDR